MQSQLGPGGGNEEKPVGGEETTVVCRDPDPSLARVVMALHGKEQEKIKVEDTRLFSASGRKICVVHDLASGKRYILKGMLRRDSFRRQVDSRMALVRYLGAENLAEILAFVPGANFERFVGEDVMILEWLSGITLHQAVMEMRLPEGVCVAAWRQILDKMLDLWVKTKRPYSPSDEGVYVRPDGTRTKNIQQGVFGIKIDGVELGSVSHLPLVINGQRYPSITQLYKDLGCYRSPRVTVYCQNDVNADNFLVDVEGGECRVRVIDYDHTSHADQRLSASHLIGWWLCYGINFTTEPPRLWLENECLHFAFQASLPTICRRLIKEALDVGNAFCQRLAADGQGDEYYHQQVMRLVSLYLIGETRFLMNRGYPTWRIIPTLGLGLKSIVEPLSVLVDELIA